MEFRTRVKAKITKKSCLFVFLRKTYEHILGIYIPSIYISSEEGAGDLKGDQMLI